MTATLVAADGKTPLVREPLSQLPRNRISGHYDAAQPSVANSQYWSAADGLSARAANSPAVRKVIRERARYEVANNCYAKGMLRTQADYVIGTGPRLQLLTEDKEFNREVSRLFYEWAESVGFFRKLWTMRFAWGVDGESFALFVNNENARHPVTLDIQLIECDQFTDNYGDFSINWRRDDGLTVDKYGNVVSYKMLPHHPGDSAWWSIVAEPRSVAASDVIHLYRCERPGQLRGVSEIAPALLLYPSMRRWTYAALSAAEKAARIAGVIKSSYSPADLIAAGIDAKTAFGQSPQAMDIVELEADSWLTMAEGWDISQLKAEQPTTTYPMFKREIISEMARCLNMPFNVAAANSAEYNFASGKLDHTTWFKSVAIDQALVSELAATPVFRKWYYEARRIPGYLPVEPVAAARSGEYLPSHIWQWDGQKIIDPREAQSKATLIEAGLTSYAREYADRGYDSDEEHESQAKSLGMTIDEYRAALRAKLFGADPLAPPPAETDLSEQEQENAVAV